MPYYKVNRRYFLAHPRVHHTNHGTRCYVTRIWYKISAYTNSEKSKVYFASRLPSVVCETSEVWKVQSPEFFLCIDNGVALDAHDVFLKNSCDTAARPKFSPLLRGGDLWGILNALMGQKMPFLPQFCPCSPLLLI